MSGRKLLLAAFIVLFAISAAQARHIDTHEEFSDDVTYSNVQCWADNEPLPKAAYASLWNPEQNAVIRGTGSTLSLTIDSTSSEAELKCRWTFAKPQKVTAFELESAHALRVTSLNSGGNEYVISPIQVAPFKKIRTQFPAKFAEYFEFTARVPCSSGKCNVEITEINVLPTDLEPFGTLADESGTFTRDIALPGETIRFMGSVGRRVHICDGFRNQCAWVQPARCETTSEFLGIDFDKDCSYDNCFRPGFSGNVQFLSSSEFDSGGCSSWFESYGLKIIGGIIIIAATILSGGVLTVPVLLLAGLGGAVSVYNIDLPIGDQWISLTVAFVAAATTTAISIQLGGGAGLYGAFFKALETSIVDAIVILGQIALTEVAKSYWSQYVTPAIVEQFDSELGKQIAAALSSALGGAVSSVAAAGVTAAIGEGLGGLGAESLSKSFADASATEFGTLSAGEYVGRAFLNIITQAAATYTAQYVAELCFEQLKGQVSNQQVAATTCGVIGSNVAQWVATAFTKFWMEVLVPTRAVEAVSNANSNDQGGLRADGKRLIDEKPVTVNDKVIPVSSGFVKVETEEEITYIDLLNEGTDKALNNGFKTGKPEDFGKYAKEIEYVQKNNPEIYQYMKDSQIRSMSDTVLNELYKTRANGELNKVVSQSNLVLIKKGAEQIVLAIQNNIKQMQDLGKANEAVSRALEAALHSGSDCSCYGQLLPAQQYQLDPATCGSYGSFGSARIFGAETGSISSPDAVIATEVGELGLGYCDPLLTNRDEKIVNPFANGNFIVSLKHGEATIDEDGGATGTIGSALSAFTAPVQKGLYTFNLTVSANATSPLANKIIVVNLGLGNLFSSPLTLPGLILQVNTLVGLLADAPHLQDLRSKLTLTEELLVRVVNEQIPAKPDEIAAARQATEALLAEAQALNREAGLQKHVTTLSNLIAALNDMSATAAKLETNRSIQSIIDSFAFIDGARQAIAEVKSRPDESVKTIRDIRNFFISKPISDTEISWSTVQLRSSFGGGGDLLVTGSNQETLKAIDLFTNYSLAWRATDYELQGEEGFTLLAFGTYRARLEPAKAFLQSSVARLASLANASARAFNETGPFDPLPQYFLDELNATRRLAENFSSYITPVRDNLVGLAGTKKFEFGYEVIKPGQMTVPLLFCGLFTGRLGGNTIREIYENCYATEQGEIVCPTQQLQQEAERRCTVVDRTVTAYTLERQEISEAATGAILAARFADLLIDAINNATDGLYSAKLSKRQQTEDELTALTKLGIALENISYIPIINNQAAIADRINSLDLQTIIKQTVSGTIEAYSETPLEVVVPDFSLSLDKTLLCGPGDPVTFNLSLQANVDWPVIKLEAGVWMPFSVPYVPKGPLRLSNLVQGCSIQSLAWWDYDAQQKKEKSGNDAISEALQPGRGYYAISSNDCTLRFRSNLFNDSGFVFTPERNVSSGKFTFVGSGGRSQIFSYQSVNEFKIFNAEGLPLETFGGNCRPLAYETYRGGLLRNKRPGNWTWLVEAQPTSNDPFAVLPNASRPGLVLTDTAKPGKAYWVWNNYGNCTLNERMPGDLQTTGPLGPAPIRFAIEPQLPSGWKSGTAEGGLLDTDIFDCGENCISVGRGVNKFVTVTPAPEAQLGEQQLSFVARSPTGASSVATAKYLKISPKPDISISKSGFSYTLAIRNTAPAQCQARPVFAAVEQPPGWNVKGRIPTTSVQPGSSLFAQVNLSPIPGAAQSGFLSIFVSSDISDRTKQFEQNVLPCVPPDIAEDIASNETHLVYTTESGIRSFSILSCADAGDAAPGISFLEKPEGLSFSRGRIIWVEGDKIRAFDNGSASILVSGIGKDAFYITADDSAVYWAEGNSIKKLDLASSNTSTIASALNEPIGIAADSESIYWAEPDRIRKVSKASSCVGAGCQTVAVVKAELLGAEGGRLWDIAADRDYIYAGINSEKFGQAFDKIIKARKDSGEVSVVTKPYVSGPITSVAADSKNIYWASGFGSGIPDKIGKVVQTNEFTERVEVPGHNPAAVEVQPPVQEAEPGVIAEYKLRVTNTNNASAEPVSPFFVAGANLASGLVLCDGDDFFSRCEGMIRSGQTVSTEEVLDTYRNTWARSIKRGNTSTLSVWVRSSPTLAIGSVKNFEVTASSNDPATAGKANATLVIRPPGPPRVEVIPEITCPPLQAGYIRQDCDARFVITVTNTDQQQAIFDLEVAFVNDTGALNAVLESQRLIVPGTASPVELNFKDVELNMTGIGNPAFGTYAFTVNATNIIFPEKTRTVPAAVTVTPDDADGICEPEQGETEENTPDCASTDFACPVTESDAPSVRQSASCAATTPFGVRFQALLKSGPASQFAACRITPGFSDEYSLAKCRDNLLSGTNVLCSNSTVGQLPTCGYTCADRTGQFRMLANAAGSIKASPKFNYRCPSCSGAYSSRLVQTDEFGRFFDPSFPGLGEIPFEGWLDYVQSEHLRADWFYQLNRQQWELCRDTVRSIVDAGVQLESRSQQLTSRTDIFPIDGVCSDFRQEVSAFIKTSDDVIAAACRVGILRANLKVTGLDIPQVSADQVPRATVVITNFANESAFSAARCTYTRPGSSYRSISGCAQLAPGETRAFAVQLTNASAGVWTAACEAGWSGFSDCKAVIGLDTMKANFTVNPSPANFTIRLIDAPPFGVQGRRFQVRVDVENTGETANASVTCRLLDPAGNLHEAESEIKLVYQGRVLPFRPQLILDQTGQWLVSECTVFKRASIDPQQTVQVNQPVIVFPECSGACQDRGFDYGGCFEGGDAIGTPGTLGCNAPEACVCGRLSLEGQQCSRSSSSGGTGTFNATVSASWSLGDTLKADGIFFSQPPAAVQRFFIAPGSKGMNLSILKGTTQLLHVQPLEFACFEAPDVRISSPPEGSTISGARTISAEASDTAVVDFFADSAVIGNATRYPYSITWDSATAIDGEHTISAQACNAAGCGFDEVTVAVSNGIAVAAQQDYDFIIEPAAFSADVVAGKSATFSFAIENTGRIKDRIILSEAINSSWLLSPSVNGQPLRRTADLEPGEKATFALNISVPATAVLGEKAVLTVSATGQAGREKRISGPSTLIVAEKENTPPSFTAVFHVPEKPVRGGRITFFADMRDADGDLISAVACKNKECDQQWCTMFGSQKKEGVATVGSFNCSAPVPEPGAYNYYVRARAGSHSALSRQKSFEAVPAIRPSGPVNIAPGSRAANSSAVPGQGAENAIDADTTTYWISQADLPQWLLIRFQQSRSVGGVGIYSQSGARPKVFDVFIGDCAGLGEKALSESSAKYIKDIYKASFDAITGQCVRLDVSKTEDGSQYASLAEFEVYESAVPGRLPTNVTGPGPGEVPAPEFPLAAAAIAAAIAALAIIFRRRIRLFITYLRAR